MMGWTRCCKREEVDGWDGMGWGVLLFVLGSGNEIASVEWTGLGLALARLCASEGVCVFLSERLPPSFVCLSLSVMYTLCIGN